MDIEYRYCEFRREDRVLSGTILEYGDEADIAGIFRETVVPGAFIIRDGILLNRQHKRELPLAKLGQGMKITDSPHVITVRAKLPKTNVADDALAMVEAGLLTGFSVEMAVQEDTWREAATHRTIKKAKLLGLAVVDSPAYPKSSVEARDAFLSGRDRISLSPFYYL